MLVTLNNSLEKYLTQLTNIGKTIVKFSIDPLRQDISTEDIYSIINNIYTHYNILLIISVSSRLLEELVRSQDSLSTTHARSGHR